VEQRAGGLGPPDRRSRWRLGALAAGDGGTEPARAELFPDWDPSGSRIAYLELSLRSESGAYWLGDTIAQINPDGECRTEVLSSPRIAYFGPAWQPGPGREAGPISC
jgi:hypothetical protein